MAWLQR